jgi:hypothetical protein
MNSVLEEYLANSNPAPQNPVTLKPNNKPQQTLNLTGIERNYTESRTTFRDVGCWNPLAIISPSISTAKPTVYHPNLTPRPSPLRPQCLAKDRICLWTPLMACTPLDDHGIPINLSESNLQRILEVTSRAYVESTASTYGTGLLVFHVFCDKKDILEAQRAPASLLLLSSFIATLAGAYSGKTITNYLYGVHAWHTIHSVPWTIQRTELDTLLRAADTLTPTLSLKPKRIPYTIEHLQRLHEHLDLSNSGFDIAMFACLTTTFWGTAQVGEMTVKTLNSFDPLTYTKPLLRTFHFLFIFTFLSHGYLIFYLILSSHGHSHRSHQPRTYHVTHHLIKSYDQSHV